MKRLFGTLLIALTLAILPGLASAGTMTVTVDQRQNFGTMFVVFGTATFSSSYATSGDTITAVSMGLNVIDHLVLDGSTDDGLFVIQNFATSTRRIKTFLGTAGTNTAPTITLTKGAILAGSEIGITADTNGTDIVNNTIAATVTGITGVQAPVFTGGLLVESTNASDLSAHVVKFIAYGR